jgi:hypothetical protein
MHLGRKNVEGVMRKVAFLISENISLFPHATRYSSPMESKHLFDMAQSIPTSGVLSLSKMALHRNVFTMIPLNVKSSSPN